MFAGACSHLLGSFVREDVCLLMYALICWGRLLGKCVFTGACSHLLGLFVRENVRLYVFARRATLTQRSGGECFAKVHQEILPRKSSPGDFPGELFLEKPLVPEPKSFGPRALVKQPSNRSQATEQPKSSNRATESSNRATKVKQKFTRRFSLAKVHQEIFPVSFSPRNH